MYSKIAGAILSGVMVVSAVLLTWRWFSIIHGDIDPYVVFYSFLLTTSLGLLLFGNLYFMKRAVEELENTKRVISISYREVEERMEERLLRGLREIEEMIDDIKRKSYR